MSRLRDLFRGRALWIGFLAAFLPLPLILGLQYWWLIKLEGTSAQAGRAALGNALDAVTTEVLYLYGPAAERALDLPSSLFTSDQIERAAAHFRRRGMPGASALFVVRFAPEELGRIFFYDPVEDRMVLPPASDRTRAVTVACAPWKLMYDKGIEIDDVRLVVEERDPVNRIVLVPIVDAGLRVVGVAGMILDPDHFRNRVVPEAVTAVLPKYFRGARSHDVVVSLRDARGGLVWSSASEDAHLPDDVSRPFSFVFTDWRLGIRSRGLSPEQWARAGFVFDITLSVLAAALLAGGLALALRTASREMRLSRMKSDFVANVSHELRTPLASIRVFGELLRMGRATTPDKVREYGEYIEAESRRLTQLIGNILDFARIEAGQKTYSFEPGDARALVIQTVETFRVRSRQSGFTIDLDLPGDSLPTLRFDAEALGQALHNLLDNAVKYSGDSRWIGVRLGLERDEIVISVEDRGIGISKQEQRHVFDRFHRVGTGLVHDVRGSGLGLSIVRSIVEAHGGRVRVESEPGRGSTFSIHLPASALPASTRPEQTGEGAEPAKGRGDRLMAPETRASRR